MSNADLAHFRVATYNIQAGIGSGRLSHVVTHSLRYLMPHSQSHINLDRIAAVISSMDIVAIQEADAGSFRSRYIHQMDYIAQQAGFPYAHALITRELSDLACMTQGLLSKLPWSRLIEHRLPASRHGRAALECTFQIAGRPIAFIGTHLSLRKSSRMRQMRYLAQLVHQHQDVIVAGDMNCAPDSQEMRRLLAETDLRLFTGPIPSTFPSWNPQRRLDHVLVSGALEIESLRTLPVICSDHLPVVADIRLT
jgi:endonuclease/exonuclease/phosphatase family metal-dependent hydrolase